MRHLACEFCVIHKVLVSDPSLFFVESVFVGWKIIMLSTLSRSFKALTSPPDIQRFCLLQHFCWVILEDVPLSGMSSMCIDFDQMVSFPSLVNTPILCFVSWWAERFTTLQLGTFNSVVETLNLTAIKFSHMSLHYPNHLWFQKQ